MASVGIVALAVSLLAESSSAFPTSTNSPPIVTTFVISSPHSGSVTVSGSVNDEYPAGCYIQFGPYNRKGYKGDFLTIRELRGGELRFDGYHRPEWPSNASS